MLHPQSGIGAPDSHTPPEQVSPPVHASPSSQAPSLNVVSHRPSALLHAASVHGFESSGQVLAVPAHWPLPSQTSAMVQLSSSSQPVPASAGSSTHTPSAGSQALAWQRSPDGPHTTTVAGSMAHTPN